MRVLALLLIALTTACASAPKTRTKTSVMTVPPPMPVSVGTGIAANTPTPADMKKGEALRDEAMEMLYSKDPAVRNPIKAREKFFAAANLGDPIAMDQIGGFYSTGLADTEKSCAKAIEWFEKASQSGYPLAVNNLAYMLVTCPEKNLRDADRAEEMVKYLFQANPSFLALLDTYAAIQAEQKQFANAARTLEVVADLASLADANPERIDEIKKTIETYRKSAAPSKPAASSSNGKHRRNNKK